jgi:hypothetical protein
MLTTPSTAARFPKQMDLFGVTTPSTSRLGLEVHLPADCPSCGSQAAVLGSGSGIHCNSLLCTSLATASLYADRISAAFIDGNIDHFGRPESPITIRFGKG